MTRRDAGRALGFLTVVGRASRPDARVTPWLGPAGAAIGLLVASAWWLADRVWPAAVAAAVVVVVDLVVTGALHVDGLADSADGLLPHMERERRLDVMASSEVGAFGVAAVGATLLLRWAALASLAPSFTLLPALWCASRAVMGVVVSSVPYARPGGLAAAFAGGRAGVAALGGLTVAVPLAALGGRAEIAALMAAVAAGAGVVALARRRLDGFTGDVLGAAGVVAETTGLLVAAARW